MSNQELLAQCVELFRTPYIDLSSFDPRSIDKHLLNEQLIRRHHMLPISAKEQQTISRRLRPY